MANKDTTQRFKIMKNCALQIVLLLACCCMAMAHSNYTQILDKKISVSLTRVTFEQALREIGIIAEVKFVYSTDQLDMTEEVSLSIQNKALRDVLDELLTPRQIKYKVHEKEASITLRRIREENKGGDQTTYLNSRNSIQQVTGTVSESVNQQPLPGVNVLIKGASRGTTTDAQGNYSIEANENDILVFSFIGYQTLEVKVGSQTTINIILHEDIQSLKEVVINAGYWKVNDTERTGNISRITSNEIQQQPVNNPLQALQGRMTGVQVTQITGLPGGGFTVRIRGTNSLREDANEPFYIVDGVPFVSQSLSYRAASSGILQNPSPLATINPADIESIEVLKDADATAIYGSRGANGVILITTKKAKHGKTTVDVNTWHGVGKVANKMELLNTQQYIEMRKEALQNDGLWPLAPSLYQFVPDVFIWDTTRHTDWQKELIGGTANITNAQVSVSGGSPNTHFSFRTGYYRETTVFPGNQDNTKGSGHFNLFHKSTDDKFNLTFTTSFLADQNKLINEDLTRYALTLPPVAPSPYDEHGNLNWGPSSAASWDNPFAKIDRPYIGKTANLNTNLTLQYKIFEALEFKANMGYNKIDMGEFKTTPLRTINTFNSATTTTSVFTNNSLKTWIIEPQVRYATNIGSSIKIETLIGTTFQESIQQGEALNANGYTSDALLQNMLSASSYVVVNADYNQYRYNAAFARINVNHKGKYIVNLTGRRDGSSRFGTDNRFGNFGAVGAAWIFSSEKFLADNAILSFGKLRMSYGTTGSDNVGNYAYMTAYTSTNYPYQNIRGLVPNGLSNPNYGWEVNKKAELALETGFFKNRIMFNAAYFRNRSTSQLVLFPLPATTGFNSVTQNMPATVQNTGLEIEVSSINMEKGSFSWTSSLNVTFPENKLIKYDGIENSPYGNIYEVGKSLNTRKRYQFKEINPQTGMYTFEDLDESGAVSFPGDLIALVEVGQQFFGGLQNSLRYKNFSLDIFFQFVKQTATNSKTGFSTPGVLGNQPVSILNRWTEAGDVADIQRFTIFNPPVFQAYNDFQVSNGRFSDASFIRLKNISLNYQLPVTYTQKFGVSKCMFYMQGQNIMTFLLNKDFVSLDPETGTNTLPPLRIVTVGLQLTF